MTNPQANATRRKLVRAVEQSRLKNDTTGPWSNVQTFDIQVRNVWHILAYKKLRIQSQILPHAVLPTVFDDKLRSKSRSIVDRLQIRMRGEHKANTLFKRKNCLPLSIRHTLV